MGAWVASLDLGTVIGVCVRVWRMPGGHVQVVGHAVLVLFVIMPREGVDVPRHGRPGGHQHGDGHDSGEQTLHGWQSMAIARPGQIVGRHRRHAYWSFITNWFDSRCQRSSTDRMLWL